MTASNLFVALLAGALCVPTAAIAQGTAPPDRDHVDSILRRIQALEQDVDRKQAELNAYRSELEALRRELAPAAAEPPSPATEPLAGPPASETRDQAFIRAICEMRNLSDLNLALVRPAPLSRCPRGGAVAVRRDEGGQTDAVVGTPLPGRPSIAPGISTTLDFANRGKASVTYSHPVIYRSRIVNSPDSDAPHFVSFRPQLFTISAGLNVPIVKDESNFLSIADRTGRADADVLPGTTVRLGLDFLNFQSRNREESFLRITRVLWQARRACVEDRLRPTPQNPAMTQDRFFGLYGQTRPTPGVDAWTLDEGTATRDATVDACSGANLINFILETESDGAGGTRLKRAALASEYQAAFWEEPRTAIPDWGFGFSVEYGTSDFRYRQGAVSLIPETNDPTRVTLDLDRNSPLAAERTDTEDDWKIQAYGAYFVRTLRADIPPADRIYNPGFMLIGAITYLSNHQFRPGASDLTICPVAAPGNLFVRCAPVNVDRPYIRDGITLSGEVRTQFNNVPVLRVLGFALRYSNRLSDSRQTVEVPVYLSANDNGWGSAGIRLRHSWDGLDLLGNRDRTTTELSVFLTGAINFRGN